MGAGHRVRQLAAMVAVVGLAAACMPVAGAGHVTNTAPNAVGSAVELASLARLRARLDTTVRVGDGPEGVITGYGSVWVTEHGDGTVSRIDPNTLRVVATIRVGSGPGHIATGFGAIWITDDKDKFLWRIDPRTNAAKRIAVGGRISCAPAIGMGRVWVAAWDPPRLVGIDPRTNRVVARIAVDPQPLGVQFAERSLWVASAEAGGHVLRIDPRTGTVVRRIPTFSDWSWLQSGSVGNGSLWVANPFVQTITRLDVRTGQVIAIIRVGYLPVATFTSGSLWVSDATGTLTRIDPATYRIVATIRVGTSLGGVAAGFGAIWVPSFSGDLVSRIVLAS
jgi:YVTN family beta-propeller protein